MAAWPTLKEVRTFLRAQPNDVEDLVIDSARLAAINFGIRKLGRVAVTADDGTVTWIDRYPADTTDLPDAAHQASLMHAARLYRRRDTVDGTIGFGDAGVVRVGRDYDIVILYDSLAPVVFG